MFTGPCIGHDQTKLSQRYAAGGVLIPVLLFVAFPLPSTSIIQAQTPGDDTIRVIVCPPAPDPPRKTRTANTWLSAIDVIVFARLPLSELEKGPDTDKGVYTLYPCNRDESPVEFILNPTAKLSSAQLGELLPRGPAVWFLTREDDGILMLAKPHHVRDIGSMDSCGDLLSELRAIGVTGHLVDELRLWQYGSLTGGRYCR